ncbi:MAG: hypothetical protein CM1200mP26_17130 [Acidimicrobiales bacterium]|nr:MAG: hypothetical protein CM1200mP26_17130 [Acidimicrobiales bacterium]
MTGLDPDKDVVVEIATLITDDDLAIVAEGPDLVVHQPPEVLDRMGDFVRAMHTKSGLLEAIGSSTTTLAEASEATMAFLREHIDKGTDRSPLRQLDRDGPTIPIALATRDRGIPALPIDRRVHHQGAGPTLAPRGPQVGARQGRRAPGYGRHPGVSGRITSLPRRTLLQGLNSRPLSDSAASAVLEAPSYGDAVTDPCSHGGPPEPRPIRQEQEQAATEITELTAGLYRFQLPISMPGLGHVNCYALEDADGLTLVDPGLPSLESWNALGHRLAQVGADHSRVHTAVVTHSHPDHFGGVHRLRDDHGTRVLTHADFRSVWTNTAVEEEMDTGELGPGRRRGPREGPIDDETPYPMGCHPIRTARQRTA